MSTKLWGTIRTNDDEGLGKYECLNCKRVWESYDSPWEWLYCPYCSVKWTGEFTKKVEDIYMKLLFLDLDGCVNNNAYDPVSNNILIHPYKVSLVNYVLEATGAKLVITSSRRYMIFRGECNLVGFNWFLRSHGFKDGAFVGVIGYDKGVPPNTNFNGIGETWPVENYRGKAISKFLHPATRYNILPEYDFPWEVTSYVVVDDNEFDIVTKGHPFIKIDGQVGLTLNKAAEIIDVLN